MLTIVRWIFIVATCLLATAAPAKKAPARTRSRSAPRRRRKGPLRWCYDDFVWFCELLTLPVDDVEYDGPPRTIKLEPFQKFILREVFAKNRAELLVLLPKGNGKTLLFAALAVFHLLVTRNAECFIGAADKEQADTMYRFARHFVESEPELEALLLVRKATREIRSRRDLGFIRVLASDQSKGGGKRHSYNPTLALIDELHAHDNDSLYSALRSATFKRNGLVVTISTAGHDEETSALGIKRARMYAHEHAGGEVRRGLKLDRRGRCVKHKDGRLNIARSPSRRTCMLEWACLKSDDLQDLRVVKLANPASFVTIAGLEDAAENLEVAQFARYRANVWAQADDARIKERQWDACFDKSKPRPPRGARVVVVVDAAQVRDTAACTVLWRRPDDGRIVPLAKVWALNPKDPRRPKPAAHEYVSGERIGQRRIRNYIRKLQDPEGEFGYQIDVLVFDAYFFSESAEILEQDDGLTILDFPPHPRHQAPATERLLEVIDRQGFAHDGDPVLRSHVLAAGTKAVGESDERFSKAASKKVIDALITLMMGVEPVLDGSDSSWERRAARGEEALL